jgi:hypothetical protein
MNLISGEVDAFCAAEFPDHYAGVAQVGAELEHPRAIVVYRRPLSALDTAVRLQFPQVSTILRFVDADYSRKELVALGRRVIQDATQSSVRAFTNSECIPEADGSAVRVVLPGVDDRTRALLSQRYGPAVNVDAAAAAPSPDPIVAHSQPSHAAPPPDRGEGQPLHYRNRRADWRTAAGPLLFVVISAVIIGNALRHGATFSPVFLVALIVPLIGVYQDLARTAYELQVDGSTLRWRGLVGPWRNVPLAQLRRVAQSGSSYWLELTSDPGISVGVRGYGVSVSSPRRIRIRAGDGLLPFLVALRERVPGLELS